MESFGLYLTTSLALVFVIEGLLWAVFPDTMRKLMAMALTMPQGSLRKFGVIMVLIGFSMVYLIELFAK